jgi:hypothetical protein
MTTIAISSRLRNEEGSIMVIVLLIMAVLTILGISAIDTSNVEIQIASNERLYKDNFYKAEAAAIAAAQTLENMTPGQLGDISDETWINLPSVNITPDNLQLASAAWNTGNMDTADVDLAGAQFTVIETTGFIDLSAPSNLHEYRIYGLYNSTGRDRGQVLIEIGYKRRF